MRTLFPARRLLFAALALPAGIASAGTSGKAATHRYSMQGVLEASATDTSAGASMQLAGRLSAPESGVALQSGDGFVLLAKLAESPLGCGSDTIFFDGFDGPG